MNVYHGSYTEIIEINLSFCQTGKDFGRGFYVTNIHTQAEYWAKRMGKRHKTKGVVTEFELDENIFHIMKLKVLRFDGYSEEWLDFIVLNRSNHSEQQVHDYDIIEGAVANDDITTRIDDYLAGTVSKEQFLIELTHNEPSHQICFCTVQSLQALTLQKGKIDATIAHIDNDVVKALITDYDKTETDATDIYYLSKTYTRLADETTELYKKSWQEIYELLKIELNNK